MTMLRSYHSSPAPHHMEAKGGEGHRGGEASTHRVNKDDGGEHNPREISSARQRRGTTSDNDDDEEEGITLDSVAEAKTKNKNARYPDDDDDNLNNRSSSPFGPPSRDRVGKVAGGMKGTSQQLSLSGLRSRFKELKPKGGLSPLSRRRGRQESSDSNSSSSSSVDNVSLLLLCLCLFAYTP